MKEITRLKVITRELIGNEELSFVTNLTSTIRKEIKL